MKETNTRFLKNRNHKKKGTGKKKMRIMKICNYFEK